MQYAATTAHCPACDSVFYGCDRNRLYERRDRTRAAGTSTSDSLP